MMFISKTFTLKCKDPTKYDECEPYEITLKKGRYIFDCVGASGGKGYQSKGGYGARVSGIARINKPTTFYIYVGGRGEDADYEMNVIKNGGYNGGGKGGTSVRDISKNRDTETGAGGGGSSDIRLTKGFWNDTESLQSRIIVAAAGGGSSHRNNGGSGGSLVGYASEQYLKVSYSFGGNQTEEHFGFGEDGLSKTSYASFGCEGNGGAGSGWYGGSTYQNDGENSNSAGSGGSSYASGYEGMAINENFQFSSVKIKDGKETQHDGDGSVTIIRLLPCTLRINTKPYFLCLIITNLMS